MNVVVLPRNPQPVPTKSWKMELLFHCHPKDGSGHEVLLSLHHLVKASGLCQRSPLEKMVLMVKTEKPGAVSRSFMI